MDNEILTWLFDIDLAITEIDSFFEEENKKYANYQKDLKTKRAVERNLEIIGEAVKRILSSGKNIKLTNARKIVDTRNRIIHGYDTVSEEIIWSIITRDLSRLEKEVKSLLDNI